MGKGRREGKRTEEQKGRKKKKKKKGRLERTEKERKGKEGGGRRKEKGIRVGRKIAPWCRGGEWTPLAIVQYSVFHGSRSLEPEVSKPDRKSAHPNII